jgi:ABC-2 type transport system ATP-binding protein
MARATLPATETASSPPTAIRVTGLTKSYGALAAVRGLEFSVGQGEIFGLIGPDGAGKTTTFHILAGVMAPSGGEVELLGRSPHQVCSQLGYLTQQFSLYADLSVAENIRYSASLRSVPPDKLRQRRARYLQLVGLAPFAHRLAGQLSGGMKQKLALCCALVAEPPILLLDEPTTGVDPVSRREFWDVLAALADRGVTIAIATPYLDEAERCHRIALVYQGQIQQQGTPAQLRAGLGLERLAIWAHPMAEAEAALQAETEIADRQTVGDRLDVLVPSAQAGEARIRRALADAGVALDGIEPAPVTLENVFVTQLRQQGNDPAFVPFPHARAAPSQGAERIAIGAERLQKTFGAFQAVRDVTLEVRSGEIYGLLGANGAGKTTTIKMLCGLLPPSSGDIVLAGQKRELRSPALRQRLGYMSQKFTLYDDLTVAQNLEFYAGVYGIPHRQRRRKIGWVLETCNLLGQENLLTARLPGGWKQRVAFGAAVMHEPEVLFLDEPTSGVDPVARRQLWRSIRDLARHGTAVLVTTHYLEEAEHCQQLGFMVAGEVAASGSPSQIKAQQPGQLLALSVDRPQAAADCLKAHLAPWRVAIFGNRLHVVADDPEATGAQLRSLLAAEGVALHGLQPIAFSLEDAFIGIVQRSQGAAA